MIAHKPVVNAPIDDHKLGLNEVVLPLIFLSENVLGVAQKRQCRDKHDNLTLSQMNKNT